MYGVHMQRACLETNFVKCTSKNQWTSLILTYPSPQKIKSEWDIHNLNKILKVIK